MRQTSSSSPPTSTSARLRSVARQGAPQARGLLLLALRQMVLQLRSPPVRLHSLQHRETSCTQTHSYMRRISLEADFVSSKERHIARERELKKNGNRLSCTSAQLNDELRSVEGDPSKNDEFHHKKMQEFALASEKWHLMIHSAVFFGSRTRSQSI